MRNVQILLADDDEDDRNFFREAILEASIDAELTTVEDGNQLTDFLSFIEEPPPPDIVFLDINMPLKNGKVCLREIRGNNKFDDVPVVMFSTSSHHQDITETYADGANLYIMKSEFFEDEVNMLKVLFAVNWKNRLNKPTRENFILKFAK